MNNDLISRSALLETFCNECGECGRCRIPCVDYDQVAQAPAVDAVSPGVLEQYKWERDTAIAQLEELGIGFGEKKPDVQAVRHGRWKEIEEGEGGHLMECSVCAEWLFHNFDYVSNYCPNCGAKMDAEVEGC